MPGLGDALSKAFEDSMHDLDALVEKAAKEEGDLQPDGAADGSAAAAEEERSGAGPVAEPSAEASPADAPSPGLDSPERTALLSATDLGLEGLGPETGGIGQGAEPERRPEPESEPEPELPMKEVPAALPGEEAPPSEPRRRERTRRVMVSADMAGEAARSAIDATRILEGAVSAAPAPESAELTAAQSPQEQLTSATTSEPVAPFAQFAASGIIRRKIRKGGAEEQPPVPIPEPEPEPEPAPSEAAVQSAGEAPAETPAAEPGDQVLDPGPQSQAGVEDVLAVCRRLMALEGSEDYRIPLLVEGVDGLVRIMTGGEVGIPGIVALCGASEKSGTSTIAVACALKLAEDRTKRVLLVDADFRSPGLARMAGNSGSGPDLKSVLTGEAAVSEAILYSPNENLAILPLYGWGEGPDEALAKVVPLFGEDALGKLLDLLKMQFDYVIFDAGSAVDWEGPVALAGATGAAVMVVRAGKTTAKTAMVLKKSLERAGSRLEGSVLTFT